MTSTPGCCRPRGPRCSARAAASSSRPCPPGRSSSRTRRRVLKQVLPRRPERRLARLSGRPRGSSGALTQCPRSQGGLAPSLRARPCPPSGRPRCLAPHRSRCLRQPTRRCSERPRAPRRLPLWPRRRCLARLRFRSSRRRNLRPPRRKCLVPLLLPRRLLRPPRHRCLVRPRFHSRSRLRLPRRCSAPPPWPRRHPRPPRRKSLVVPPPRPLSPLLQRPRPLAQRTSRRHVKPRRTPLRLPRLTALPRRGWPSPGPLLLRPGAPRAIVPPAWRPLPPSSCLKSL
jgi:hypothetical protein